MVPLTFNREVLALLTAPHLLAKGDQLVSGGLFSAESVARAQEFIRKRIDQFGVAEPTIQRQGDNRIIIELPGVQDVQRAKDLVGQTALLEFQLLETEDERNRLLQRINALTAPAADTTSVAGEEEEEKSLF